MCLQKSTRMRPQKVIPTNPSPIRIPFFNRRRRLAEYLEAREPAAEAADRALIARAGRPSSALAAGVEAFEQGVGRH